LTNKSINTSQSKFSTLKTNISPQVSVIRVADLDLIPIENLLNRYQLKLKVQKDSETIKGSYWGDSEAGLLNDILYVRNDTPIHSLLHEACHYVCMDQIRRDNLDTNAEGDYAEENAVCYLQILLADKLHEFSSDKMMQDMDSWGYTFRLGSAKAWFNNDAEDALEWLQHKGLLDSNNQPNFTLRSI